MSHNYIASDYELMIDICKSDINFLKSSWQNMLGRPLVVMAIRRVHLGTSLLLLTRSIRCFTFERVAFFY